MMLQNESPLKRYQQLRERLSRICEEVARFAVETEMDVIEDPQLEGWVTLSTDEVSAQYKRKPLAQLLTARAQVLRSPFRVAVMGEFSRGKSTLINALLGQELLTTNFRPNTAVRTTIRASTSQRIQVHFLSGQPSYIKETNDIARELAAVTSDVGFGDDQQALLQGARKSLAQQYREVEVYANLPFLRERDIDLIDTPGLGSVFESHQTVAYSVLAEAEVVLYAVQFDPGIGAEDIDFLTSTRGHKDRFLFLLTKRDVAKTPAKLQEVLGFMGDALRERVGIKQPKIFPVAAAFALNGRAGESGIAEAIHGIETGLVTISGVQRIRETLRFLNTCNHWFGLALARTARRLEQAMQLANQRLESVAFRSSQARQLQSVMRAYLKDAFAVLLADLNASINELPRRLQFASEAAIDRLGSESLAAVEPHVVSALQMELQNWLQEKQKHMRRQATSVLEHTHQIMAFLTASSSTEKTGVQADYTPLAIHMSVLNQLLALELPALIGLSARLGMNVALKSIHARYKQHLLAPVAQERMSLYQIALDGINATVKQPQPGLISVRGIRRELEAAFSQACQTLEGRYGKFIDSDVQLYLNTLTQEREKILKEQENMKQQIADVAQKLKKLEDVRRRALEVERENQKLSAL